MAQWWRVNVTNSKNNDEIVPSWLISTSNVWEFIFFLREALSDVNSVLLIPTLLNANFRSSCYWQRAANMQFVIHLPLFPKKLFEVWKWKRTNHPNFSHSFAVVAPSSVDRCVRNCHAWCCFIVDSLNTPIFISSLCELECSEGKIVKVISYHNTRFD